MPLSRWGDRVDVVTNFKSGDAGDSLDIAIAEGLSGTLLARAVGADTLIYFAEQGTQSFADARLLLRLDNVAPASLTSVNFAGAAFTVVANQTLTASGATPVQGGWGDDTINGDNAANTLSGGAGNDTFADARDGNDTLTGGTGNDWLRGGGGNDTYVFNRGDGQDTISDWNYGTDTIQFGADITAADVVVTQGNSGQDLVITFIGTDDRITIERGLSADYNRIEQLRFSDGSTLSYTQMVDRSLTPTAGNDTFSGDQFANTISGGVGNDTISDAREGDDTLIGGIGNDWLRGGSGNDTYIFNRGDGQDVISDWNYGNDTIQLGVGITAADLVVTQANSGQDLVIAIVGTEDKITVSRGIDTDWSRIELLRFSDGSTLSYSQLLDRSLTPTSGDDTFAGDQFANTISGGAGNDTILDGRDGDDILIGGTGNDWMRGGNGNDTYVFNRGDGQDIISDWSYGNDTILFGAGIAVADLSFTRASNGQDLIIAIAGTEDKITVSRGIDTDWSRIEQIRFADGSTLDFTGMLALADANDRGGITQIGAAAGNAIVGTDAAELLNASAYAAGGTLDGRGGYDELTGSAYDDVLIGGTGNDMLTGGAGADTYRFSAGFGQDTIQEYTSNGSNNIIVFDSSLSIDDFVLEADVFTDGNGNSDFGQARLRFAGTDDRITIADLDTIQQILFCRRHRARQAADAGPRGQPLQQRPLFLPVGHADSKSSDRIGEGRPDRRPRH